MNARALRDGDLVECSVKGVHFTATVISKQPQEISVYPEDPKRFTWRRLSARQILKRISRPADGEVAA
jgi:hypothetical protein